MAMIPTQQMQQSMQPQGGVEGLLGNQGGLQNLAGNPLFNMGMGLLQSRYDPRINPFGAMIGGLQAAGEQQRTIEEQRRDQELREALQKYFEQQGTPPRAPSAIEQMTSPSVQRGLMANALDPQNQALYQRMAWREILGQ